MARPEITGKRGGVTPVKPKRSAGPATADPDAIESRGDADATPRPLSPAHRARGPPPQPLAFSVEEFCRAHGISIGFFYALLKRGEGPEIMKLGTRTLISAEEAARWRAERTAASSDTPGDAV
jgi:hypothetical protein